MRMKYGPKRSDHPSVGKPCAACGELFAEGDYTTLIELGPGNDPEEDPLGRVLDVDHFLDGGLLEEGGQ